ncbi:MAG: hypothetical protein J6K43_16320 [Lachnospiraceae bacterium]|nr:hypothetical protein [Lachnospiraceae bacterium]
MSNDLVEISAATTMAKRTYKDTVFRMLFSDKKELLALYNAINDTHYENPDELIITTLKNAIYMSMKNDISCVIDMRLNMYEHQSTVNPNIPLRDLDYVSRTYSTLYKDVDVYSTKVIQLPNPKFIVFYNGKDAQPPIRKLKLSDAFVHAEDNPSLELIVTQININPGFNEDLMEKCKTLKDYMIYVERVRIYQKEMSLEEAVNRAVDECIKEGILAQFLKKNKAEVINMSLFEYDEKLHEKTLLELGRETGIQGTVTILKSMGCTNDEIIEKLMGVYELDLAKAKSFLD